jgi:hypothetical protein
MGIPICFLQYDTAQQTFELRQLRYQPMDQGIAGSSPDRARSGARDNGLLDLDATIPGNVQARFI